MPTSKKHKAVEVTTEDYDYINEIREMPLGKIAFSKVIHNVLMFWKENH